MIDPTEEHDSEPLEEEDDEGEKFSITCTDASIAGGFLLAVPLVFLTQLLGLGMVGLVLGGVFAALLAMGAVSGYRYLTGNAMLNAPQFDWTALFSLMAPEEETTPLSLPPGRQVLSTVSPRLPGDMQMRLSPEWHMDVEQLIGAGVVCYGIKGAGKSEFGALLSEQFGQFYIPMVIFDIKPDYLTLVDVLPNGQIAGDPSAAGRYPRDKFIALDLGVVPEIGQAILSKGYQVIIDLTSYPDDEMRAQIMTGVVDSLMSYAAEIPNEDRVPCLVFTDEASRWFPQDRSMRSPQVTPTTFAGLLYQFVEMSNQGRSLGVIPAWFDQRPANFDKRLAAQSDIRVYMRQSQDTDIARYRNMIGPDLAEAARDFAIGEAVVMIPRCRPFRTTFYRRRSQHMSNTPKAAAAIERFGAASVSTEPVPRTQHNTTQFRQPVKRARKFTPSREYRSRMHQEPSTDPQTPATFTVQSAAPEWKLNPEQETEFIRRFKACGSIREAIAQMHVSYGRYQKHASQIVKERNLRRATA